MKTIAALCLFVSASFAQAANVTIDFEEFAYYQEAPLESQGFTIRGGGSGDSPSCCAGYIDSIGASKALSVYSFSAGTFFDPYASMGINVARTDNAAFALYSMDIYGDFTTLISGRRASDNAQISGTVADLGSGDWLAISSFALERSVSAPPGGFGIEISGAVDNIVVGAAVPIPAAVWLFASALAGLTFMRRLRA